jgi:hypothetical protein
MGLSAIEFRKGGQRVHSSPNTKQKSLSGF